MYFLSTQSFYTYKITLACVHVIISSWFKVYLTAAKNLTYKWSCVSYKWRCVFLLWREEIKFMDVDGKNRKEKIPLVQLSSAFLTVLLSKDPSAGLRYNVDLGPEVQQYHVSKTGNYQHPQLFIFLRIGSFWYIIKK